MKHFRILCTALICGFSLLFATSQAPATEPTPQEEAIQHLTTALFLLVGVETILYVEFGELVKASKVEGLTDAQRKAIEKVMKENSRIRDRIRKKIETLVTLITQLREERK